MSQPTSRLLVLSAGEEVAKRIENHLRNAGHPVRAAWVTDLEDMEEAIRRAAPDLVLVQEGMPNASAKDVLTLCSKYSPDLPVLRLATKPFTMVDTIAALRTGVRGLVIAGDALQLQHLETICLRELGTHQQLRDLRQTRAQLADFAARHEKLMAGTGDCVLHVMEGIVTDANAAFAKLLGHKSSATIEGNPLMDLIAPNGTAAAKQFLKLVQQDKLKADHEVDLEFTVVDGGSAKVRARATLGAANVDGDRLLELFIRAPAAVEAPKAAKAEPAAAPAPEARGSLSSGRLDLFNTLNAAITANVQMHRALILVMVDSFGTIEQRLGYHEAELALAQLAELARTRLGSKEPLHRFSTALIAMVVSRPNTTEFEALAETLRKDVAAQLFRTDNYEAHLAVTVVCYPLSSKDKAVDVVDAAVREVRKLSREGGNRIAVMGAAAQEAAVAADEQRKVDQIKRAIAENRLKLAYQSIASLEGGDRNHFDVLARMVDDAGQEMPAKDFIPTAAKFNLIVAIDRWVIQRALIVLAKRQGAADAESLFLRLSEQSVREGDALFKWLTEQLKLRPLKKGELVFSVTEEIVESHVGKAKALAQALRGLGVEIALDQYGSGKNSVKMLEHLAPNYVRFDYSFSKDFGEPAKQRDMADLMDAAKQARARTIVGQVEDANAMARLWQLGVNYIQGFHIQAPEAVLLATDVR